MNSMPMSTISSFEADGAGRRDRVGVNAPPLYLKQRARPSLIRRRRVLTSRGWPITVNRIGRQRRGERTCHVRRPSIGTGHVSSTIQTAARPLSTAKEE
jgi:hypothetical protein